MFHALKSIASAVFRGSGSLSMKRAVMRRVFRDLTREFATTHPRYFSQHGQDLFVDNFIFRGKRGGVFVDIGAYDGVTYSNTCFLERELGWTGLCIEPNPRAFKKLCQSRQCKSLNAGVGNESKVARMLVLPESGEMGSGFLEYYPAEYQRSDWLEGMKQKGAELHDIQILNINELFIEHDLGKIDFLSIDTEGADFAILKTIDLVAASISVITIENNSFGDGVYEYLAARGYELRAILGTDEIYQKVRDKSFKQRTVDN